MEQGLKCAEIRQFSEFVPHVPYLSVYRYTRARDVRARDADIRKTRHIRHRLTGTAEIRQFEKGSYMTQAAKTPLSVIEVSARAHRILELIESGCESDAAKARENHRLQSELADAFGQYIGGRRTKQWVSVRRKSPYGFTDRQSFSLDVMPHEFFDHRQVYAIGDGRTKHYAIAAHLYHCDVKRMAAFAEEHLLGLRFPPFPSWYYPSMTTLVLWTDATKGGTAA